MKANEIYAASILNKSEIPGISFCLNPYTGCQHACRYCYAEFMKKYTGHQESWGQFVDVKINAAEVLSKQLKAKRGKGIPGGLVFLSTVTDPYQPIEKEYRLTRQCLELLRNYQIPVAIQTKSPLVLRDIDLFQEFEKCEVGLSITTENDYFRKIFEPQTSSIIERIKTLEQLKKNRVKTYAFIGPILPMRARVLANQLKGLIDKVYIDKMNYSSKVIKIYREHNIEYALTENYFQETISTLTDVFKAIGINIC